MTMSCACLLSARGEAALREARDLILLGVFGMSAASPALSASSSAGASRGSIPGAANPALVATSVMAVAIVVGAARRCHRAWRGPP